MTNNNNNTNEDIIETIDHVDHEVLYRGSIHFFSQGREPQTSMAFDFSHQLSEAWNDNIIPGAFEKVREVVNALRRQTTMYAATPDDIAYLNDPNVSDEDKALYILSSAQAQEEALKSTLN